MAQFGTTAMGDTVEKITLTAGDLTVGILTWGAVIQSARLLATDHPHVLGDVFPQLCAEAPPRASQIWEASRFCPAPSVAKGAPRRQCLGRMIAAILEVGILFGFEHVSFVASAALAPLAERAGWSVRRLGEMKRIGRERLVAMLAEVSSDGLTQVRRANGLTGPITRFADPSHRRAA